MTKHDAKRFQTQSSVEYDFETQICKFTMLDSRAGTNELMKVTRNWSLWERCSYLGPSYNHFISTTHLLKKK